MNRSSLLAFFAAALAGGAIWCAAPAVTGQTEPWDEDGIYYIASLLLAGLLSGLVAPRPLWALYAGSIFGQLMFQFVFLPLGPLVVIGVAFLLAWSLLFLAGAYTGSRVRRHFAPQAAA